MGSLLNSMSLMLEEFYRHLSVVGVSSMTGHGVDDFFKAVDEKVTEFQRDYQPELERRRKEREEGKANRNEKELGRLLKDLNVSRQGGSSADGAARRRKSKRPQKEDPETMSDVEDEKGNDDDIDNDIPADLVDPDDEEGLEEEEEEDGEDEEEENERKDGDATGPKRHHVGLTDRYQEALRKANEAGKLSEDDHSYARYLRSSSGANG